MKRRVDEERGGGGARKKGGEGVKREKECEEACGRGKGWGRG